MFVVSNRIFPHRRFLAAAVGAVAALPFSIGVALLTASGWADGVFGFALIAPLVGALIGALLGTGVRPSPAPMPSRRVAAAGLLAVPLGSYLAAVLASAVALQTRPIAALSEAVLYSLIGDLLYGWLFLLVTVPSAILGAWVMQRVLRRLGAADGLSPRTAWVPRG